MDNVLLIVKTINTMMSQLSYAKIDVKVQGSSGKMIHKNVLIAIAQTLLTSVLI